MKVADNTIGALISFARRELKPNYSTHEADAVLAILIKHFLQIEKHSWQSRPEQTINQSDLLLVYDAIKELISGKPVQYITGKTEFYKLSFDVNSSVLIPRPETEELVDMILKEVKTQPHFSLLDIGTGSGCIAVSIKKNAEQGEIFATDISEEALSLAQKNAVQNKCQINFIKNNILDKEITSLPDNLDIIVSNPPYVRPSEQINMEKRVKDFEPHLALFAEENDPLIFYRIIAQKGKKILKSDGRIYFEINSALGSETKQCIESEGYVVELFKDLQGRDRMLKCRLINS